MAPLENEADPSIVTPFPSIETPNIHRSASLFGGVFLKNRSETKWTSKFPETKCWSRV